jgi:hypothetical protein
MTRTKSPLKKPSSDDVFLTCEVLCSLAETYPPKSRERRAIREAAEAFIFVRTQERVKAAYEKFSKASTKTLTRTQKRILRQISIEP